MYLSQRGFGEGSIPYMGTDPPSEPVAQAVGPGPSCPVSAEAEISEEEELDDGAAPVWLAHADRCWKAEEANATRLAARANLVLSGVTAIIGLKLFAIGKEIETILDSDSSAKATLFWVFGGISGILLLNALIQVLGIRRWELTFDEPPNGHGQAPSASAGLGIPTDELEKMHELPALAASWRCFFLTYDAFTDLQERNAKRKEHVDSAQRKLFWAILCLALTMGLYTWISHENRLKEKGSAGVQAERRFEGNRSVQPKDGPEGVPHQAE